MDGSANVEIKGVAGAGAKSVVVDCFAIRDVRDLIVVSDCDPGCPEGGALGPIMPHSSFIGNTFAVYVVECLICLGEIMTEG